MSNIKVGDTVKIKDTSYACVYKDGYVPFYSYDWNVLYRVVATELVLPSVTVDGREGRDNDTILQCIVGNELIYIRSAYLTLVPCEDKQIARLQNVVDDLANRLNNMTQLNHILEAIITSGAEFYTNNYSRYCSLWIIYKNKPSLCIGGRAVIYSTLSNPVKTLLKQISFQEAKNIFSTMKKSYSWTFEEIITQSPHVLIRD